MFSLAECPKCEFQVSILNYGNVAWVGQKYYVCVKHVILASSISISFVVSLSFFQKFLPQGVLLFLETFSLIGTVQDWLFYQPRVRRIPKTSTEHEKPLQKMSQEVYSKTKKFIERQK